MDKSFIEQIMHYSTQDCLRNIMSQSMLIQIQNIISLSLLDMN